MAKKPKKEQLIFNIEFQCTITVRPEFKEVFEADLKRGELACSAKYKIDGVSSMFSIYSDNVSGGIEFKRIDESTYVVSANGTYATPDSFDQLPEIRTLDPKPALMLTHVSDSRPNQHYINGDEDATCPMGTFAL